MRGRRRADSKLKESQREKRKAEFAVIVQVQGGEKRVGLSWQENLEPRIQSQTAKAGWMLFPEKKRWILNMLSGNCTLNLRTAQQQVQIRRGRGLCVHENKLYTETGRMGLGKGDIMFVYPP